MHLGRQGGKTARADHGMNERGKESKGRKKPMCPLSREKKRTLVEGERENRVAKKVGGTVRAEKGGGERHTSYVATLSALKKNRITREGGEAVLIRRKNRNGRRERRERGSQG